MSHANEVNHLKQANNNDIWLTISEMAKIHGISRQTLIYYDKIKLFSPSFVDANGYRYYSAEQIPLLREICFLKSIGIRLEDIKIGTNITCSDDAVDILRTQEQEIAGQIDILNKQMIQIRERIDVCKESFRDIHEEQKPSIQEFPERKAVWLPWDDEEVTHPGIHRTLSRIWNILLDEGYLPNRYWGAVLFQEYLDSENPLQNAGGCTFVPREMKDGPNTIIFPAGKYACMSKYGMPYETKYVQMLLQWIKENGYKVIGNIYDACIMDSIIYKNEREVDLCQLQIPIAPL
ncbi:MerR family transcriptional regulator [Parasporobacterium paucivorans]|uniref:DNA-binding transcriptional regulator, MerR family n=1 Tax=Parasporobacterium paucivorans DSM 15970 TaxID=1122934 RepID=A0A1M6GZD1_9FIRM|nr:MerR family transcriptional regulator [Parasporobacterium paucivorans]SHJ15292.1 DNA-binding transcriptional regulator, MerR family [Parasporobacterium paucivorans DSM 15970]